MASPVLRLNDGRSIPIIGLGTYNRGGSRNKQCQKAVEAALDAGYKHIDTASFYANEEEIGVAIKNKITDGTVKREDIFITTKLWNDRHEQSDVVPALKESLSKLGLDYVDLYLIHWPISTGADGSYADIDYLETWKGMEECQRLGLAKSIGVSNFNEKQLQRLIENCMVIPAVNQVEINVNLTQRPLVDFCQQKGIVATAYSPFGSMPETKTSASAPAPRTNDPILTEIGNKYGKTTTQIVLRYLVERNIVVIPKSYTPKRIEENFKIFDFKLTDEEIAKIDNFNCDFRVVAVAGWKDNKYYPF